MKKIISIIALLMLVVVASAQNISVASFKPLLHDQSANLQGTMKIDQNGEVCAIIKVQTTATGLTFDVGVLGIVATEQKAGEVWVYVPHGVKRISIGHPTLGFIRDYSIPCSVDAARTYELKIDTPQPKAVTQKLTIKYSPVNAVVMVDDEMVEGNNGSAVLDLPFGTHTYRIVANGYYPQNGTVELRESAPGKLLVELDAKEGMPTEQAAVGVTAATTTAPQTQSVQTLMPGSNRTFTVNGFSFTMIAVEGGTFTMGATNEMTKPYDDEKPTHLVTLSSYSIGETEVTQTFWEAVMGKNPSSHKGANRPVENVSWFDCQTFIQKLNSLTGQNFRLPTEAEWEFAARGGNRSRHTQYSGNSDINAVARYSSNSGKAPHDVKTKQPNEFGIYDMTGNVWEWCSDWYGSYSSTAQTNPTGPSNGSRRVFRGGSTIENSRNCRSSCRNGYYPGGRSSTIGFRLAL